MEATEALSQEKCVLNGNKKTAKLSPAPLLIDVRVRQYKRTKNEEKEASI